MSETMAEKKKEELEELERMAVQSEEDQNNQLRDKCPNCGTYTSKFAYIDMRVVQLFGWVECPICGVVFCPESIRLEKAKQMQSNVKRVQPGTIIAP